MLKSNCKAVRMKVREWIMDNIDFSSYDEWAGLDTGSFSAVARALLETCKTEKFYCAYSNVYDMLYDWFQGLPTVIDTAYYIYHCNAVDLLGDWLEETPEEKARFNESDAERMINYLIAREIVKEA